MKTNMNLNNRFEGKQLKIKLFSALKIKKYRSDLRLADWIIKR